VTKEEKGKVEEIRERERAASAGPWRESSDDSDCAAFDPHGNPVWLDNSFRETDREFAVAARTDVPFLLDLSHRLDVTLRKLQEKHEKLKDQKDPIMVGITLLDDLKAKQKRLDVTCRLLAKAVIEHEDVDPDPYPTYCRFCHSKREHESDCAVLIAQATLEDD